MKKPAPPSAEEIDGLIRAALARHPVALAAASGGAARFTAALIIPKERATNRAYIACDVSRGASRWSDTIDLPEGALKDDLTDLAVWLLQKGAAKTLRAPSEARAERAISAGFGRILKTPIPPACGQVTLAIPASSTLQATFFARLRQKVRSYQDRLDAALAEIRISA